VCGFDLVVVEGTDRGARVVVDASRPSRLLAGQSSVCELRLTDSTVSRRHAAFEIVDAGLRLTDLGSTNGTIVNGVRVLDAVLQGGESVRLGDTTLRVERAANPSTFALSPGVRFGRVLGSSVAMRRLFPVCQRIASSDVPVVIEGETGTGKELLAESLHEESPRASAPFVVFDCTTVAPELFESALFGHERGAFTGAVASRRGAFELAENGTLFIDEIGELSLSLQAKLLRVIERSEVQRVGSEKWKRADVRIIAATRRDLDATVAEGRFRDDLFYRLNVARIELPPLSRRQGDVEFLATCFWSALGGSDPIPAPFLARLIASSWPGNVRQLRNEVVRQIALGDMPYDSTSVTDEEPPRAPDCEPAAARSDDDAVIARVLSLNLPLSRARQMVVEHFERLYLERALAIHDGNVRRAAASSGVARRYFQILRARRDGR
jgi:transcriptional regulator with GAF, ATPase, and Fis domain